jgi:hypothetical protein
MKNVPNPLFSSRRALLSIPSAERALGENLISCLVFAEMLGCEI